MILGRHAEISSGLEKGFSQSQNNLFLPALKITDAPRKGDRRNQKDQRRYGNEAVSYPAPPPVLPLFRRYRKATDTAANAIRTPVNPGINPLDSFFWLSTVKLQAATSE